MLDADVARWLDEIDGFFWILNSVAEDCICENYKHALKAYDGLVDLWPGMTDKERRDADKIFGYILGHYLVCLTHGSGVKPGCERAGLVRVTCGPERSPM